MNLKEENLIETFKGISLYKGDNKTEYLLVGDDGITKFWSANEWAAIRHLKEVGNSAR